MNTSSEFSLEPFKAILKGNSAGLMTWDPQGLLLEVNDYALEVIGYDRSDIENRKVRWDDLIPPELKYPVDLEHAEFKDKGFTRPAALEIVRKDGTRKSIIAGASCLADNGTKGISLIFDISKVSTIENELARSEARYRALADNASVGIAQGDLDHRLRSANKTLLSWLEIDKIPPVGLDVLDYLTPESKAMLKSNLSERLSGKSTSYEIELISKSGIRRTLQLTGAPYSSTGGEIDGLIASFVDITEMKRAMQLLKTTLETIPEGVIAVSEDDRVLTYNQCFIDMWQIPDAVVKSHSHTAYLKHVATQMVDFESFNRERLENRDKPLWKTPLRERELKNGRFVEISRRTETFPHLGKIDVIYCHDVTERKKFEQRLLHADRMSIVGILAAGVAHEINNPLTHLIFGLELVADKLSDPHLTAEKDVSEIHNRVEGLVQSAVRIADIVKDLKTFSRSTDERIEAVNLQTAIESLFPMVNSELKQKARLITDFQQAPLVQGNPGRMSQVFLNLIVNALQAMIPEKRSENILRVSTKTNEKGWAQVEISDTGVGIKKQDLRSIFEPFYTTKPVGTGTGLGLSICQNIVKGLQGEILVESTPDQGTKFTVVFPPAPDLIQVGEVIHATNKSKAGKNVLFVDDEPAICELVQTALSPTHSVRIAQNGKVALDIIKRDAKEIDVIICDLMMPIMNGMEFYQTVQREWPAMAEKFIFITGGAMNPSARNFIESVKNPVIYKPFTLRSLRNLIEKSDGSETSLDN